MILFNLMSINIMDDNDTINWKDKTITLRHNIKLLNIIINHYPEQTYEIKNEYKIVYNWSKFIKYWYKHLPEYIKAFNIEFDTLTLYIDYTIAPIFISNDRIFIGIYIYNTKIIKNLKNLKKSVTQYRFLSSIEHYLVSNTNKYNFIYGILNKHNSNNNSNNSNNNNYDTFKNKKLILDTNINIPIKYILQNSINYFPKLEINRIKMISRNHLNP